MIQNKTYKKEFCSHCFKETKQDQEICKCGSRHFVFGDNIEVEDGKFVCSCGSTVFKMTEHFHINKMYNCTYKCVECGVLIGTQGYLDDYDDL